MTSSFYGYKQIAFPKWVCGAPPSGLLEGVVEILVREPGS